jgi:hypothetical protein
VNLYNNHMNESHLDDLALRLSNSNNGIKLVASMLS